MTRLRYFIPPPLFLLAAGVFVSVIWTMDQRNEANLEPERKTLGASENPPGRQINILPDSSPVPDYAARIKAALDRPLFSETRQRSQPPVAEPLPMAPEATPPVEPIQEPSQETIERPDIRLLGVARFGITRQALIYDNSMNMEKWLKEGDPIGEWHVYRIARDLVELRHGQHAEVVKLQR